MIDCPYQYSILNSGNNANLRRKTISLVARGRPFYSERGGKDGTGTKLDKYFDLEIA